jgi:hypothetical protein
MGGGVGQVPCAPPLTPGFDWAGLTCEHIPLRWPLLVVKASPPLSPLATYSLRHTSTLVHAQMVDCLPPEAPTHLREPFASQDNTRPPPAVMGSPR